MIIQNHHRAGWKLIRSCRKRLRSGGERHHPLVWSAAIILTIISVAVVLHYHGDGLSFPAALQRFKVPQPNSSYSAMQTPVSTVPPPTALPATYPAPTLPASVIPSPPATETTSPSAPRLVEPDDPPPLAPQPMAASAAEESPAASQALSPPEILGRLRVKPGDTLVSMVRHVYGGYRHRLLRAVIESNPQLRDPNNIEIGQSITFPAIRFDFDEAEYDNKSLYWIILEEHHSLSDALTTQAAISSRWHFPARVMTSWTPNDGLLFNLAVPQAFHHQATALDYLATIPAEAVSRARIVKGWSADSQLYSIWFLSTPSPQEQ